MNSTGIFLVEFYTKRGEIKLTWVYADDKAQAKAKLMKDQGKRFDCIITNEEASEVKHLPGCRTQPKVIA